MAKKLSLAVKKALPESVLRIIDQVDASQIAGDDAIDVESVVGDVAARWASFGKALHIRPAKLDVIKATPGIMPDDCLKSTIAEFLKMNYDFETHGVPSWRLIVIALAHKEGGNNTNMALRVAGEHGATITDPGSASVLSAGTSSNGAAAAPSKPSAPSTSKAILEERPDMKYFALIKYRENGKKKEYRPVNDISMYWEAVAGQLNVNRAKIANAGRKQDAVDSANEVIQFWLESNTDATWSKLINAMRVKEQLKRSAKEFKTALLNMINSDDEESDDDD